VGTPFDPTRYSNLLNIVLNETHHYFFYDEYRGPKVAYNVWESTRQPEQYFNRILEYDQFWCPTEWQKIVTIEQGYPADKVFVVPEGINPDRFRPNRKVKSLIEDKFVFVLMGRWDYRKSIKEIIEAFSNEFKANENVALIINVDNPFSVDNLNSTEERLEHYKISHPGIVIQHFMSREDYIYHLQNAHCLVSCSRSEGWNLPLMEAIACGTPTICSNYGAQLEFARGISHPVRIKEHLPPKDVFLHPNGVPGTWAEPDFQHLQEKMREVYENYEEYETYARLASRRVRTEFTWENAAQKALEAIEKIENISIPVRKDIENPIKINLGCGADIKKGYINVDTFNNFEGLDVDANILELPFKNDSVDEIFISHTMEHLGIYNVPQALNEFNRVLKPGGELVIITPDLESCIEQWQKFDDEGRIDRLEYIFGGQSHDGDFHKNGFTENTLKIYLRRYGFSTAHSEKRVSPFGSALEIYNVSIKERSIAKSQIRVNCHFVDGPFLEVLSNSDPRYYEFKFTDMHDGAVVHKRFHRVNHWTRPHRKWFTPWLVELKQGFKTVYRHEFNATGKRVLISFESKSLGDTIAWLPYCEQFRLKHRCHVIVSTFWNKLFRDVYTQLEFTEPGTRCDDIYASYQIGCWDDDPSRNRFPWQETPIQKIASDTLGLEFEEIRPKIKQPEGMFDAYSKYVTLSEGATAGCKQWQHPNAWQTVVDFLVDNGYKVMVISKEPTELKNVIDMTNKPIEETIRNLKMSEFYMGVSSGPAWLAWALEVPVIMVSGCTHRWNEFQSNVFRVINERVCHGCFNTSKYKFDRGEWFWCPVFGSSSPDRFQCTKNISPQDVIDIIKSNFMERTKNKNGVENA
jgi:autotransporter strand-loop-strand O-heptosyltransferase